MVLYVTLPRALLRAAFRVPLRRQSLRLRK